MGNCLTYGSSGSSLAAAVSCADVHEARRILQSNPDAVFYQPLRGGKTMVAVAASRGHVELLDVLCKAAERARGKAQLRSLLSVGFARGDSALMCACSFGSSEHVACVSLLMEMGADAFCTTTSGENCLHVAARHAHERCIRKLLNSWVSLPDKPASRLAEAVSDDISQLKFVDVPNGSGMTALHLATIKGSAAAVSALLRQGASADAQIIGTSVTPWLAQGSTALHIAAARGYIGCVSILLEYQCTIPGMELRRIRNFRGLKPSQLARMGGHAGLARLLSEGPAATRSRAGRRRRRHGNRRPRHAMTPDALLATLVQRAKLLMALRSVRQGEEDAAKPLTDVVMLDESCSSQAEDVSVALAEVLHTWRKGGCGSKSSLTHLLSLTAGDGNQELDADGTQSGRAAKTSYAAAAMVQAAVNAIASCTGTSGEAFEAMPSTLAPTTAAQAATALQAALHMLTVPEGGEVGDRDGHRSSRHSRRTGSQRQRATSLSARGASQSDPAAVRSGDSGRTLPHSAASQEPGTSASHQRCPSRRRELRNTMVQLHKQLLSGSRAQLRESSAPGQASTSGDGQSSPMIDLGAATQAAGATASSHRDVCSQAAPMPSPDPSPSAPLLPAKQHRSSSPSASPARRLSFYTVAGNSGSGASGSGFTPTPPQSESGRSASVTEHGAVPPVAPPTLATGELHDESCSQAAIEGLLHSASESGAEGPAEGAGEGRQGSRPSASIMDTRTLSVLLDSAALAAAAAQEDEEDEEEDGDSDGDGVGEGDHEEEEEEDELGLEGKAADGNWCPICMDRNLEVVMTPCAHSLCLQCAYQLCARGLTAPQCPFCRGTIRSFAPPE